MLNLFAAWLALAPAALAGPSILTLPHKQVRLPNGFTVSMVKYPSPGVVAYELPVHAGSRNEVEKGKTGFAHFFEHLMFRGTRHRSGKQLSELYTRLGNDNNAWTGNDMTDYHGVVASIYLDRILEAEADRFENLFFDEKQLRDEAGAVLGEYNKDAANPDFQLEEKLDSVAYTVHPYAHSTMGYKEDILKFTERYHDVWPFFRRYYRPSNVSLVLVGDLDFDKTLRTVKKLFGPWKNPKVSKVEIPVEPPQTAPRTGEVRLAKPTQTRLEIAWRLPAFTTKNTDASVSGLIAEMLFSTTSEFVREYRFEKKWVDSVGANSPETVDPGLLVISLRLSEAGEGRERELLEAVDRVIAGLRDKPVAPERLAATKERFRNAAVTGWFASPERLAGRISYYTNLEPDLGVLDRQFERLGEVTSQDILAFARQYLVDRNKTTILLHGASK